MQGLPTLCDKALGDCNLSGSGGAPKGLPLDGVSAWGAIARGEPSLRTEIMHDLWYHGNPDPEIRASIKPHWAALHLDGMKLLIGSGANDWELYNITEVRTMSIACLPPCDLLICLPWWFARAHTEAPSSIIHYS